MGTFITDGALALPGTKVNATPPTGAATEWSATDINLIKTALLDLRTAHLDHVGQGADVTAPAVGTLTVPNTAGRSITGITASATDATGVVKWMIKEGSSSTISAPFVTDLGWTSITPTVAFSSSALTFTSSASSTGVRFFRIYFADAAGNVGLSGAASATITISGGVDVTAPVVSAFGFNDSASRTLTGGWVTATDAVGVVAYKIVEQTANANWPTPGEGTVAPSAGGWTSIASTTSFDSTALTFMSPSTVSATLHHRLYALDAAGNCGMSNTDTMTLTISSGSAPSVSGFSVPDSAGTWLEGISATATDSTGLTGWMIKEAATDSFTPPTAGSAGWQSITSTTSFSASDLTFQSPASTTGVYYHRIYFKNTGGTVGASTTDEMTLTVPAGNSTAWTGSTSLSAYPKTGSVTSGDVTVNIDVTDGNGSAGWGKFNYALGLLTANETVLLRNDTGVTVYVPSGGISRTTAWGSGAPRKLFAYGTQRVKLDCTNVGENIAVTFSGSAAYEHWKGFEILNHQHFDPNPVVWVESGPNCTFEDIDFHHNTGGSIYTSEGADILIQDCRTWHQGDGSNQDTLVADAYEASSPGAKFVRCFTANAPDDGFDLFYSVGADLIDCVSVGAGIYWNDARAGDGSGFKMGGETGGTPHIAVGCISVGASRAGFHWNQSAAVCDVQHCTAYNNCIDGNAGGNYRFRVHDSGSNDVAHVLEHNISWVSGNTDGNVNDGGDLVESALSQDYNCWDSEFQGDPADAVGDPVFVGSASGNLYLGTGSPYIGTGLGGISLGASDVALDILIANWSLVGA